MILKIYLQIFFQAKVFTFHCNIFLAIVYTPSAWAILIQFPEGTLSTTVTTLSNLAYNTVN